MPTNSTVMPVWYTKLRPQPVQPNPMDLALCDQVYYTRKTSQQCSHEGQQHLEGTHCRVVI